MRFILALFFMVVASLAQATAPSRGPALFCSGKQDYVEFIDQDGRKNTADRDGAVIRLYRASEPESGDWILTDSYVLSPSGKTIQISRTVIYAGHPYVYAQITDGAGRSIDNRATIPEDSFVPDDAPFLADLADFCKLRAR